ncbi:multiple C2 and transmembrane domain-containing protein 1-like isoform X2 [Mytilus galloprovincialis]|uniref:multiple C2 and transmembrane domain-containing protein 1-like isoform X1 n=3 Tax=Mytilus galloprovincialis TaxID=29158 RepID=UPI003F7CAA51
MDDDVATPFKRRGASRKFKHWNFTPQDVLDNEEEVKRRWTLRTLVRRSGDGASLPNASSKSTDRRVKSSIDLRTVDSSPSRGESPPSPQATSTRRRFWNSFRNKTSKKLQRKSKNKEASLSASQPNICNDKEPVDLNEDLIVYSSHSIESREKMSRKRLEKAKEIVESSPDRSLSDPNVTPIKERVNERTFSGGSGHSHSDENYDREDEGDSGIAVIENPAPAVEEIGLRQRKHSMQHHACYDLEIILKEGRDLVIRDSSGTSDPYVKFKLGNKMLHKSKTVYKNLNPQWNETFHLLIEDLFQPVQLQVYDYDRGRFDDPMGSADIDLSLIELNESSELKLELSEGGKEEYMGYLLLQCTLTPKTSPSTRKAYTQSSRVKSTRMGDAAKKMKNQIWTGVVTIVLVEGSNLIAMDDNGFSDPYVKFKLGTEKYKSKHKLKTLNPRWLEQFDLRMFDDQSNLLELSVYDHDSRGRDDFMGRAVIDLSGIEKEVTHTIDQPLEDEGGIIKLLLTISGTVGTETISDLANYTSNPREKIEIVRKYGLFNSFKNIKDIGWLQIKVFRAQGLIAADFGGTSDPFCVLELDNARLQTQTEYKTLNPEWNKVFTFNIKDIHSILEVTVYDEDRDKKVEFLGKIAIPLLNVRCGEKRWYTLKDKKLLNRTKGAIMLEIDVVYNPVKSAIRTVNPREEKYMKPEPKFKIATMKRNIARVTQMVSSFTEVGKFLNSCFEWESKPRTITAFIVYLVAVWFFEPYMLPITLLLVFLKNLAFSSMQTAFSTEPTNDLYVDEDDDDDDDETKLEKDEKKSVHEIYKAAQEVCLQVQQGMDMVASLGERFKNTFNWTVPWLSTFAVILLSVGAVVLYFIPVRVLVMLWGINKFTKKLRAPNAIPNNELLDFLSRVPSDSELVQYKELRPDIPNLKKKRS